jgi:hypothetical protein
MATGYPAAIDDLDEGTRPGLTHGDVADSVEVVQVTLGTNPQGAALTVRENIEAKLPTVQKGAASGLATLDAAALLTRTEIPFGPASDDVSPGNHGHEITAYNRAGTLLTTAPAIQGTGDADIVYNTTTDRLEINVPTTQTAFIRRETDLTLAASSTTPQEINSPAIGSSTNLNIAANTSRRVDALIAYNSNATADFVLGITGLPTDATVRGMAIGIAGPNGGARLDYMGSTTWSAIFNGSAADSAILVTLLIYMGPTAGYFAFTGAQNTADLQAPIIRTGSWLGWALV